MRRKSLLAIGAGLSLWMAGTVAYADVITDINIDGPTQGRSILVDLASELGVSPGTSVEILGIGWDLTIEALFPSWFSEVVIRFTNSAGGPEAIFLTPGPTSADETSGVRAYSSGGIIDLVGVGISPLFLFDGQLLLTFFETFDDSSVDPDGYFIDGSIISVQARAVPEPGTLALLGAGLIGIGFARRRKKA